MPLAESWGEADVQHTNRAQTGEMNVGRVSTAFRCECRPDPLSQRASWAALPAAVAAGTSISLPVVTS